MRLFGTWAGGHHLSSVVLHALNTWLAWTLLVRLGLSRPKALLATALFAFHPLRVESVAWISERKDVLSVCFALLTLLAWVSYRRTPGVGRYLVVMLAFGAGLASKVMVMTLPLGLAVLDLTLLHVPGRARWKLVVDKLPLLAMSAAAALAVMDRMRHLDAVAHPVTAEGLSALPWALARYVANTVWPAKLCVIYPRLPLEGWQVGVGLVTVLAVTGFSVFLALRERPGLLVGWGLFLLTLSPVLGLGQTGEQLMADRYTHLGHLALFAGLVWSLPEGWFTRRAPALVMAAVVLALFVRTLVQLQTWQDSDTLFAHALAVEPNNPPAQKWVDGLALERLLEAGRMEEGEAAAQALLQRWPRDVELWVLSGTVAARAGNYALARRAPTRARWRRPFQRRPAPGIAGDAHRHGPSKAESGRAAVVLAEPRRLAGRGN